MSLLTDNEKAAIAGRVWEPGGVHCSHGYKAPHTMQPWSVPAGENLYCDKQTWADSAPDMHDPANWARALENHEEVVIMRGAAGEWNCEILGPKEWVQGCGQEGDNSKLADAAFAALVALYDAEHQGEKESGTTTNK